MQSGLAGAPSTQDLTAKIKAAGDKLTAGDNPAADFTNRAEKAVKSAKRSASGSFSNPARDFANQAKSAVKDAAPGSGDIPNPAKEFAKQVRI